MSPAINTIEDFKHELLAFSKNFIFTCTSEIDNQNQKETFYVYYPGGNMWYDCIDDETFKTIQEDYTLTLKYLSDFNHGELSNERKNYLNLQIFSALWAPIFNQTIYATVDNKQFKLAITRGNGAIEYFTLEESAKYIKNRPNQSEIILRK